MSFIFFFNFQKIGSGGSVKRKIKNSGLNMPMQYSVISMAVKMTIAQNIDCGYIYL